MLRFYTDIIPIRQGRASAGERASVCVSERERDSNSYPNPARSDTRLPRAAAVEKGETGDEKLEFGLGGAEYFHSRLLESRPMEQKYAAVPGSCKRGFTWECPGVGGQWMVRLREGRCTNESAFLLVLSPH